MLHEYIEPEGHDVLDDFFRRDAIQLADQVDQVASPVIGGIAERIAVMMDGQYCHGVSAEGRVKVGGFRAVGCGGTSEDLQVFTCYRKEGTKEDGIEKFIPDGHRCCIGEESG